MRFHSNEIHAKLFITKTLHRCITHQANDVFNQDLHHANPLEHFHEQILYMSRHVIEIEPSKYKRRERARSVSDEGIFEGKVLNRSMRVDVKVRSAFHIIAVPCIIRVCVSDWFVPVFAIARHVLKSQHSTALASDKSVWKTTYVVQIDVRKLS